MSHSVHVSISYIWLLCEYWCQPGLFIGNFYTYPIKSEMMEYFYTMIKHKLIPLVKVLWTKSLLFICLCCSSLEDSEDIALSRDHQVLSPEVTSISLYNVFLMRVYHLSIKN